MIEILTTLIGDQLAPYLACMTRSAKEIYGDGIEVSVAYADVSEDVMNRLRSLPINFREVNSREASGDSLNIVYFAKPIYAPMAICTPCENKILMDVDTMWLKDVEDIYLEKFDMAWGRRDDGDPKINYSPVNTGVILTRWSPRVESFLSTWADLTRGIRKGKIEPPKVAKFKGDQEAFVLTMGGTEKILKDISRGYGKTKGVLHRIYQMREFNCNTGVYPETRIVHFNAGRHLEHKRWTSIPDLYAKAKELQKI